MYHHKSGQTTSNLTTRHMNPNASFDIDEVEPLPYNYEPARHSMGWMSSDAT